MTLLEICQNVAQQTGFPKPATIVSNNDETARRLLNLANLAGRTLQRAFDWSVLQKEHTFNTVASTASYALPDDFERFVPTTAWDRTQFWALQGPLNPQEWQLLKSGIVETFPRIKFRVKPESGVKKYTLLPTPDAVYALVYEYVSNEWVIADGGTIKETFTADDDTPIISPYLVELSLKYRFLNSLGLAYAEEKMEFDNELAAEKARDGGMRTLFMGDTTRPGLNVPESGYGS